MNTNTLLLGIVLLISCGENNEVSTNDTHKPVATQNQSSDKPDATVEGKTTVIGNLEIAAADNPEKLAWFKASQACIKLGDGWRLPTIEELHTMYENREKIGGFDEWNSYWSSNTTDEAPTEAWVLNLHDGKQYNQSKSAYNYSIRAVRNK